MDGDFALGERALQIGQVVNLQHPRHDVRELVVADRLLDDAQPRRQRVVQRHIFDAAIEGGDFASFTEVTPEFYQPIIDARKAQIGS